MLGLLAEVPVKVVHHDGVTNASTRRAQVSDCSNISTGLMG